MARILLVEPDYVLARIYAMALQRAGHKVRVVADAQAAIDRADRLTPDVVVLELQLAGHNGIEFLYEFRSYSEWQAVPVIINSGVAPGEIQSVPGAWEQLGIAAYHYKPRSNLRALLASVEQVLEPVA